MPEDPPINAGHPAHPSGDPDAPGLSRRIATGAGWAQVSRLAEVFSSLVLSLLLVRALGPMRYGQYSFLVSAATMGAVILSLGFADTLLRYVAALYARHAVGQVRYLVRRLFIVRLLAYTVGTLVIVASRHVVATTFRLPLVDHYWVPLVGLLVSQGAIEFATAYAYARQRARDVAVARTIGQVIAVAFFTVMVWLGRTDTVTAAITVIISYLSATGLVTLRGLGSTLFAGAPERTDLHPIAGFAAAAWGISLGGVGLAGQIDVVLLGAISGDPVQIAFYSVATLVFVKVGTLLSGWVGTATASVAEIEALRGPQATGRLLATYLRLNLVLSLLAYPPLIALASPGTHIVFGPAYSPAGNLMAVYGLFWLLSALAAAGIPLAFLLGLGLQRRAFVIRLTTGLLNVVLDVLFIPRLGALGAIFATGIANAAAHIADYVIVAPRLRVSYPWSFAARLTLNAAVSTIPAFLRPQRSVAVLAVACSYFVLFAAGLLWIRPLEPSDIELVARVSRRSAVILGHISHGGGIVESGSGRQP